MKPELRFVIDCSCGHRELAGASQAGTAMLCSACRANLTVPGLRELKQLNAIDVSPIGQLEQRIVTNRKPFDGDCQICGAYRGSMVLPVTVAGVNNSEQTTRAFTVPCVFCDMCAKEFRSGLWLGRLQSLGKACLNAIWLLMALIIATIVAFILPLIGIFAVLGFVSSLGVYLTRKRANPYLLRHLDRICMIKEIMDDADEYEVRAQRMRVHSLQQSC